MNKVLVMGCNGFIGSHLTKYLQKKNEHVVYGADLFEHGTSLDNDFFNLNEINLDYIFKNYDIDYCVNCAGSGSVSKSISEPLNDFNCNTTLVLQILESIKKTNKEIIFLNLSSAAVYGNPIRLPIREEDILSPISPYGYNKMMSEILCQEYMKLFLIKTYSLRIFSAYGPGLRKQLFWDFYMKYLADNNRVKLFGDGSETRDFIFISDLVIAIHYIIKTPPQKNIINIANGAQNRISEIADIFFKKLNPGIDIQFSNEKLSGYPEKWEADITSLKSLGYEPRISIELGIDRYIEWLKEIKQ